MANSQETQTEVSRGAPMTDLERYGRHEEGCDSAECLACGLPEARNPHHDLDFFRGIDELRDKHWHAFHPKPCSCGFASALLVHGWQPIETAPKDDVDVLVAYGMRPDIAIANYSGSAVLEKPDSDGWLKDGIWLHRVTHWQPLPAPPGVPQKVNEP